MTTPKTTYSYVAHFLPLEGFIRSEKPGDPSLGFFEVLKTWTRRSAMRNHMGQLDDRLLADVGLDRADVESETRKPFWRA